MKILFAAPFHGVPGGILRWAQHVYAYYQSINNQNIELIPFSIGRSRFININQSVFYRLYFGIKDYIKLIYKFKRELNNNHYDIIHISSSASISLLKDLLMIKIARQHNIRTIVHFHFGRIPELKKKNNWEWKLLLRVVVAANKIIVMDQSSYSVLSATYNNIYYVPNPIAPEILQFINNNKEIKKEDRKILFVGHAVKTKGVFELVQACKKIDNIKLRLVGYVTNEIKNQLIIAAGNDSKKWLDIVGEEPYENVLLDMLRCDVFVLPTYTEGFPNVILESMACGCAIISTKVGAIPEMLGYDETEKCGLLIDPRNEQQLEVAIKNLLNASTLKDKIRINAQKRVSQKYSMSIIWDSMKAIWNN